MAFQDQLGVSDSELGNLEFGIGASVGGGADLVAVPAEATGAAIPGVFTGGAILSASPALANGTAPSPILITGGILIAVPATTTGAALPPDFNTAIFSAVAAFARGFIAAPGSSDGTAGLYPAAYGELP